MIVCGLEEVSLKKGGQGGRMSEYKLKPQVFQELAMTVCLDYKCYGDSFCEKSTGGVNCTVGGQFVKVVKKGITGKKTTYEV